MLRLLLGCCFGLFFIACGAFASTKDSLLSQIEKELSPSTKLNLTLQLSNYLIEYGDKSAIIYSENALALADSLGMKPQLAEAFRLKGLAWKIWGDNTKSAKLLFKALDLFKNLKMKHQYAEVLRNIGETYRSAGHYENSLKYLYSALDQFQQLNNSDGIAKTYNRLAATYFEKFYFNPIIRSMTDKLDYPHVKFQELYKSSPDIRHSYDSTLLYINNAFKFSVNNSKLCDVFVSTNIIKGALFNIMSQTDSALALYKETLRLILDKQLLMELPLIYHNIGSLYINIKDYQKAIEYGKMTYEIAIENEYKAYIYLSAGLLSFAYESIGDYKNANEFTKINLHARSNYMRKDIESVLIAQDFENKLAAKVHEFEHRSTQTTIILVTFAFIICFSIVFLFFLIRSNIKEKNLNSDLINRNELINSQKLELEKFNQEKDKFLSIIAHDLKNPLGSLKNLTELIYSNYHAFSDKELADLLLILRDSSTQTYTLIENLLEWSRTQRNLIKTNPEYINLSYIIKNCFELLSLSAENKKIELVNQIDPNVVVFGDIMLLTTVFRNLISNSIKFTKPDGSLIIGVLPPSQSTNQPSNSAEQTSDSVSSLSNSVSTSADANNFITVFVRDTGIGMPETTLSTLFQIDNNVRGVGTNGETGTGLWLILCKEFIALNGGDIRAESIVGVGTTFYITLKTHDDSYLPDEAKV